MKFFTRFSQRKYLFISPNKKRSRIVETFGQKMNTEKIRRDNLFKFENKILLRGRNATKKSYTAQYYSMCTPLRTHYHIILIRHTIQISRLLPHSLSRLWIHLRTTIMSTIFYTTYNNKYTLFVRNGEINHWKRLLSSLLYPH